MSVNDAKVNVCSFLPFRVQIFQMRFKRIRQANDEVAKKKQKTTKLKGKTSYHRKAGFSCWKKSEWPNKWPKTTRIEMKHLVGVYFSKFPLPNESPKSDFFFKFRYHKANTLQPITHTYTSVSMTRKYFSFRGLCTLRAYFSNGNKLMT